jgi:O-antigen ligase
MLNIAVLALGPIAVFAPRGLAVAMPLLALLAAWATRPDPRAVLRAALPPLPLLAVALLSASWSITPGPSAARAAVLAIELGLAALVAVALPARALPALTATTLFGAALIIAELGSGGPLTQGLRGTSPRFVPAALSNGTTAIVLLAPAAACAAWRTRQHVLAGAVLVAVAVAAALGGQLAAVVGVIAAIAGGCLALAWRPVIRALAGAASAAILAMPLLLPLPVALACRFATTKLSFAHRIFIWNFAEAMRAKRPWTGWGIETTRAIPGGRATGDLWTPCGLAVPPPEYLPSTELLPLHTHNAALQLWLELGPAGAVAACVLLAGLAFAARARDAAGRAAQAATLAAGVVIAFVSYGAWQGWWVATLALAAGACAALNPASARHPPPPSGP